MAYNLGPSAGGGNSGGGGSSGTSGKYYGRVVDVIQNADHPEYQQYGESNSINGVFFRNLNTPKTEDVEEDLKFAYYRGFLYLLNQSLEHYRKCFVITYHL